jgi:tetratricopeptide (TPR) repeat protein
MLARVVLRQDQNRSKETGPLEIRALILLCVFMAMFLFVPIASADTVYLKTGQKVEGKIIEKTNEFIKIDFTGVVLTYWLDEIEKVEPQQGPAFEPEQKEKIVQPTQRDKTEAYFKSGTNYLIEGNWQQAISEYKSALLFDANDLGSHFNLGCAYSLVGEYERALEEFDKALITEAIPYNAFCFFNKAGIYTKMALLDLKTEKFEEAAENFRKAAENFQKTAQILPHFSTPFDFKQTCSSLTSSSSFRRLNHIPEIIFAIKKDYPPNSCLFLNAKDMFGTGKERSFAFTEKTVPMLYFWRTATVEMIIGFSYALQGRLEEADKFLNKFVEKLSLELIQYRPWLIPKMIVCPRSVSLSKKREEAISALTSFCGGEYEKAEELAKEVLSQDPSENIAKNVLEAVKLLKESKR